MMNHKHENMDEEKSFEVIQEDVPKTEFEHQPHLVRRGLTEVSAMFDRTGKGYLDETERALRRMDSQDRGFLGIDKVCVIFESLQSEQERSSQLLEALRVESKKSLNLKKGVIALSVFTILLALANVGTSFAVSKLVKDTQVAHGDLLVKGSDERIGTTSKLIVFEMEGLDEGRRRRLQNNAGLICETMAAQVSNGDGTFSTEKECSLQGLIKLNGAQGIHDQLKIVDKVVLTCNNKKSTLFGTSSLPVGQPGPVDFGGMTYRIFPDASNGNEKYDAVQRVLVPAVPAQRATPATSTSQATPARPGRAAYNCDAKYELAMYCPTDLVNGQQQECLVMSAYLPTAACPTGPEVCGPATPPSPLIV